jgi:1,4-dihydroxy-2-naphthoate polyprenyltransferase
VVTEARPIPRSITANWAEVCKTCQLPPGARIDPVSRWLMVTRACVQPMTLTAGAIAGFLAARDPSFDLLLFALAALGIVLAHAANNMINDYFDLSEGLDTDAYPRALYAPHPVLSGVVSKSGLAAAILVVNALDALIMVVLFMERGWPVIAFALGGLFVSVFYVAPPLRFKARGLGEPSVFAIWGPLMVGGTYYSATGHIPGEVILASIPYALLVTTVLMGKHLDKAPWDAPANIKTLPVILGDERGRALTVGLMVAFYVSVVALVGAGILPVWTLAVALVLPGFKKVRAYYGQPKPDEPPERYPLWPLWFVSIAFLHARRAGALLVLGLALGAVWPVYLWGGS